MVEEKKNNKEGGGSKQELKNITLNCVTKE